jgi:WD40 repeat protein
MAAKGKAKFIDIFLWKASTQEVLANFKGFHRRAIRILQFSPSGDKLLSVGDDDQHSVAVYSTVGTGGMICNAKVDPDKMYDACWKDENSFAIVGLKCVKFFEMQGQNFNGSKGIYGSMPVTAMFCCAFGFKTQTFLTGTPTGELVIWNGRTVSKA